MTHSADGPAPALDPSDVEGLREALLAFFDGEARRLPWRETADPYAIWVSEIMLQQTRVETVVPYWSAWMEAYPTVEALACAGEEEVLKAWEGLGYYSRARNLHRAARVVRETFQGRLPDTRDGLRALPGIGAYTAGAVASIAFGEAVPAVDGNVRRVASRLLDWPDPSPAAMEREVGRWVPEDRPGDFNQALMELGATVCTPRTPSCGGCPAAALCRARAAGTELERPAPRKRAAVRTGAEVVTVAWRPIDGTVEFALRQRPAEGLLGGMYEFPGSAVEDPSGPGPAVDHARKALGSGPDHGPNHRGDPGDDTLVLPPVPHAFTHLRITYHPVLVRWAVDAPPPAGTSWFTPPEVEGLPLPVAQQSILRHARAALDPAVRKRTPG
ncbi:MAG: A/G-specific adenine glycosylase [Gemmatimonadota bacterium]